MKYFSTVLFMSIFLFSLGFAKNIEVQKKEQNSIIYNSEVYNLNDAPMHQDPNQSREQIDLILEDFETTAGDWDPSEGWQVNTTEYHSETTSYHAPDYLPTDENGEPTYKSWDLFSPLYSLPALGDGESMHFDFWLNLDMPGAECDGDNYLDDYYGVSILDIESLAWHTSDYNSTDGDSWFCGFEDIGNGNPGYLDAWVQYLDTPSFEVPAGGTVSADLFWALESPAGASVAGTCTDGWDQANVQISVDGGESFTILESGGAPYDFGCGYGMVYNGFDCNVSGDCPGWGGMSGGWNNVEFDISSYAGQNAIIRYAFYSDPGWSTMDAPDETGFQVDNIVVSGGTFTDTADDEDNMNISGAVWVDQFYDYWDDGATYDPRPGSNGWEQYVPGLAFNGNVFMDISDFAEKDVTFRIQSRYDENHDGGQGAGLYIDDVRIYKLSGGSYPSPTGLMGEAGDMSASLSWNDMNASGTDDFIYDNDSFDNGITVTGGSAWAGERIDLAGPSTINSISVFGSDLNTQADTTITVSVFGQFGSLFGNEAEYSTEVSVTPGAWTTVDVSWDMNNAFIVAHEFSGAFSAALDESAGGTGHSMVMLNAGWDNWNDIAAGAGLADGEWGVRANVTFQGAGVTYNVYQDGVQVDSGLTTNSATVDGLDNNTDYEFAVSATYDDGEESGLSSSITVTPFAQTVHEEYHDDGSAESYYDVNAAAGGGSGNFTAVKYSAAALEDVVRFKWFQEDAGGAFYVKVFADDNGMPGDEVESQVVAGGLVSGWNDKDLLANGWTVSGDFWIGTKTFSSSQPLGLDDSGSGNSYQRFGSTGEWTEVPGNLMVRVFLDCGNDCDSEPECTAGDVNSDGIINVLDIVAAVNFVLGAGTPDDSEACAADYNGDGIINVLDIVAMVNVVLGG